MCFMKEAKEKGEAPTGFLVTTEEQEGFWLEQLVDARRPLVEALRRYGQHGPLCICLNDRVLHTADCANCTCGLSAALRAADSHDRAPTDRNKAAGEGE